MKLDRPRAGLWGAGAWSCCGLSGAGAGGPRTAMGTWAWARAGGGAQRVVRDGCILRAWEVEWKFTGR